MAVAAVAFWLRLDVGSDMVALLWLTEELDSVDLVLHVVQIVLKRLNVIRMLVSVYCAVVVDVACVAAFVGGVLQRLARDCSVGVLYCELSRVVVGNVVNTRGLFRHARNTAQQVTFRQQNSLDRRLGGTMRLSP